MEGLVCVKGSSAEVRQRRRYSGSTQQHSPVASRATRTPYRVPRSAVKSLIRCDGCAASQQANDVSAKKPIAAKKTPLEMLLEWSAHDGRPEWQRDAVRRIVEKGALSAFDTDELVQLAKHAHGDETVTLRPEPLAANHLPTSASGSDAIALSAISDVVGVNQLAAKQTLPFAVSGMTIVYGSNGSGKSGYARILKKICRARFPGEIMPDAFSDATPLPAAASVHYQRGGAAQSPVVWADAASDGPHPVLSAVSVFDRESAAVHLRDENEVAYRPFGLDIPDELASACAAVKEVLNREKKALEAARSPLFSKPSWDVGSRVGCIMSGLKADTDLVQLRALAVLSEVEKQRHAQLTADLARDPAVAAAEHRLNAEAVKRLSAIVERVTGSHSDAKLANYVRSAGDARELRAAATAASAAAFAGAPLDGIGNAAWRALWDSAQRFAAGAGPGGARFVASEAGAPCVLCQQDLSAEAAARVASFTAFVADDIETAAVKAEQTFDAARQALAKAAIETSMIKDGRQRLLLGNPGLAADVLRYLAAVRLRARQSERAAHSGEPLQLTSLPASPIQFLRDHERQLRNNAQEISASATGEARAKLVAEQRDLADRLALDSLLPIAEAEVARLRALQRVANCVAETSTTAITHLSNSIADTVITPHLQDRFQEEIVQLAAERIRVKVVRSSGKYGTPHYQIRFFKNADAPVTNVLSEGEQTCVALAAFLTELATASTHSTLVFDDPITSLDHKWRKKVAERLVKEAAVRQIIVFTHDLVFLNDLRTLSERASSPVSTVSLDRGVGGAGVVSEGLPWKGKSVLDRVDSLEKDARTAQLLYDAQDEAGYRDAAHKIYGALRSTWERAVEDVAFSHVIMRHRDYVDTKHLRKVSALNAADCDALSAHYKKCCDEIEAHDPSRGRDAESPPPADIFADIKALRDWVDDLRNRQVAL